MRRLIARYISIILVMLVSIQVLAADENKTDLVQAYELYINQDYQAAREIYQNIVDSGLVSDELYYNLGNCHYKLEDFPSSILYYEKALKLNSRHEDAQHNLNLVNELHADKIEEVPTIFLKKWDNKLIRLFPKALWTVIWMISFALLLIGIAGIFITRRHRKLFVYLTILMLACTIFDGIYAMKEYHYQNKTQSAIVFTPTLNVKSSPDATSATLFVIHEGTKVKLLDNVGDWYEVQIADGSRGWINEEDFIGI